MTPTEAPRTPARTSLRELAWLFAKLGFTAFGGPAAHISMMEEEVVRSRGWLSHEQFLDMVGATNLIPGPNSTEMAIHIGHARARWAGLVVAGLAFILPAVAIVTVIAWAYVRYGTVPAVTGVLYGMKPVIIAVVVQALWKLGRTAIKTRFLGFLAVAALAASLLGVNEMVILLVAGMAASIQRRAAAGSNLKSRAWLPPLPMLGATTAATTTGAFGLVTLFLGFLKIGALLFGSGYVLLAFMRGDLVNRLHWLTEQQLLDAMAIGQVTPGPLFTTATFVGYVLGGGTGAAVATIGIFLPAFVFVAISGPLLPRIRASKNAGAVLDGVNVASLALMAAVTLELGRAALVDVPTTILAVLSAAVLVRYRLNSAWLVLAGAMVGLVHAYTPW